MTPKEMKIWKTERHQYSKSILERKQAGEDSTLYEVWIAMD